MNKQCFKTVFSKRLGCLVAVGEHAASQGKANGAGQAGGAGAALVQFVGLLAAGFASVSLAWAQPASNALPTGGVVAQGAASVSTSGAVMNIQQSTAKAVLNWQSFDIGSAARVNIVQPGAEAVILNRVTGVNPSQIFGQLSANGQVVLVNPNGVLFGKDGSVSASSFTASTLGISDTNFMAGNLQFERNGSSAAVDNQGSIKATGGYVALLGASVSNEGKIETNGGTAYLAAAETVKVPLSGSGRIKLELSASSINAQVANSKEGTIVTQGGQVYMQAAALNSAVASIIQSGAVDTTGEQGGAVHLLADGGQIKVDGSITANSTNAANKGGDIIIGRDQQTGVLAKTTDVSGSQLESKKGFVETSGHELKVDSAQVIAKDWLLDPDNIDITGDATTATEGYSKIKASDINTALNNGTSVTISTTAATRDNQPRYVGSTATGDGNILVNAAILKDSSNSTTPNASLTLLADNGITVNKSITSTSGKLDVTLTAKGMVGGKPATGIDAMTATERSRSAGLLINNTSINANGGDITLTGTSYADNRTYNSTTQIGNPNLTTGSASATSAIGKGVQIHNGSSISAKNITITGTAENQANETSYGVVFQRYATAATLSATGDIKITGTLNGTGNGSGVSFSTSGWGAQAPMLTADGNFTLRANNRASTSNTAAALYVLSGMQVKAVGDITVQAETNNAAANAMNFYSGGPGRALPTGGSEWDRYLQGNTSFQSVGSTGAASGNVLIQANQGSIVFNNNIPTNLTNGSLTALTDIKGKNITIDNTGAGMGTGVNNTVGTGGIDSATGAITAGSGKATGHGIHFVDARNITAAGNLNIMGASTGAVGINGAVVMNVTGDVKLNGSSSGTNANAHGVFLTGAVTSSNGAVSITGTSSHASGGGGASIQGAVNAKNNITLHGRSGNTSNVQGLVIQNVINSSDGDITVTGETKAGDPGQRAIALAQNGTVYGSLTVADGKTININANTLVINAGSSVDAGTGKVNIKTLTSGNEILIGGEIANDVMSTSLGSQKLGIDNTELSRIKAGNLVIGDTASTGKIIVADATTTLSQTGNIILQTGGNILVDKALTLDNSKTLTLKAGGTVTDNDTTGVIKASKLELLGSNAVVTLDSKQHEVGTLAADVKSLNFSNKTALTVGAVNTINSVDQATGTVGITAKEGVSVTTETGHLSLNKLISNSTSGNVVVGAGVSKNAGDSSGGDVKTTDGIGITNNNGKTLVYSGSASGTGKLSYLNSSLANLVVNGLETQNADTNVDFNSAPLGIAGSTANAQVMFREKLTFAATVLVSATLNKTYGDDTTANGQSAALFTEAIRELKIKNADNIVTGADTDANRISVAKSAVIDSLEGSLTAPIYYNSTNTYLKAKTHDYGELTGTKYTINVPAGVLKVEVAKRPLTGTVGAVSTPYGINASTGVATVDNVLPGDANTVETSVGLATLSGGSVSGSGNRNVGTYTQAASLTVKSGVDSVNYTTGTASSDNYVVTPKAISATVTAADKVYDGNAIAALQATSADILPGDQVSVGGLTGTFASKNVARDASGNVVAQAVTVSGSGASLGGNDGANYVLSNAASIAPTSARITPKDLTVTGITASDKVYDGTTAATIAVGNAALAGVVSGDAVSLAGQAASGNFASKNVAFDGTGAVASQSVQVAGLTLGGSDARNYTLTGQTSAQAKILQRAVTIAGSVAQDKSYDGNTTATVVPGQLSNLVTGESLNVSAAGTFADAEVGSNKVVNATYRLANGTNGLASNYTLTNASEVLRAAILSANRNPLSPIITPSGGTGSTRVVISGSGSSGAAVGVADDEISNRQECSVLHPEKCECEESTIPGIEMCYAPNVSLNNKD